MKFSDEENTIFYQIAYEALLDADLFDDMCDFLDISDTYMQELRDKLHAHLEGGV